MKHLKRILLAVAAIILVLVIAVFAVWGNEISTLMSFEHVRQRNDEHLDGSVYMTCFFPVNLIENEVTLHNQHTIPCFYSVL